MTKTNLEELTNAVGFFSALYIIISFAVPIVKNLYAQYGAIVIIIGIFVLHWLGKPARF